MSLRYIHIIESELDFVGKPTKLKSSHDKNRQQTIVVEDDFLYYHVGRLKSQQQTMGNHTETIVENTYDALGQLESKAVGGAQNVPRLQTIDYSYNIRG